jgi:hypothetical protein
LGYHTFLLLLSSSNDPFCQSTLTLLNFAKYFELIGLCYCLIA